MRQPTEMSKPRTKRWFFVTLAVLALLYLVLTMRSLLLEADASLGLSRISGSGLKGLIVNISMYTPPADSVVTLTQVGMLVHVAIRVQQMANDKKTENELRQALASILNHYTTSLSEYHWVRTTVGRYMGQSKGLGVAKADSINYHRLALVVPRLMMYTAVFRDSLDREGLLP